MGARAAGWKGGARAGVAAALLVVAPSVAGAQSQPGDVVADPIADARAELESLCDAVVYPDASGDAFFRGVEITGDGLEDVVIRFDVQCDGVERAFCGRWTSPMDGDPLLCAGNVYVALPEGGYVRTGLPPEFDVVDLEDGRRAVRLTTHAHDCGAQAPETCQADFVWNGAAFVSADGDPSVATIGDGTPDRRPPPGDFANPPPGDFVNPPPNAFVNPPPADGGGSDAAAPRSSGGRDAGPGGVGGGGTGAPEAVTPEAAAPEIAEPDPATSGVDDATARAWNRPINLETAPSLQRALDEFDEVDAGPPVEAPALEEPAPSDEPSPVPIPIAPSEGDAEAVLEDETLEEALQEALDEPPLETPEETPTETPTETIEAPPPIDEAAEPRPRLEIVPIDPDLPRAPSSDRWWFEVADESAAIAAILGEDGRSALIASCVAGEDRIILTIAFAPEAAAAAALPTTAGESMAIAFRVAGVGDETRIMTYDAELTAWTDAIAPDGALIAALRRGARVSAGRADDGAALFTASLSGSAAALDTLRAVCGL